MRALAKEIHISMITVQRAYDDLQRDGFIDSTIGRRSFVSAQMSLTSGMLKAVKLKKM